MSLRDKKPHVLGAADDCLMCRMKRREDAGLAVNQVLLWVGSSKAPDTLTPLLVDVTDVLRVLRMRTAATARTAPRSGVAIVIRVAT